MAKKMDKGEKAKVVKHLKGDIKGFKKEANEDKELIKKLAHKRHEKHESKKHEKAEHKKHKDPKPKKKGKVGKVLHEFKAGELHSGSKKGPKVKSKKQAVAIALSEARKAGEKVTPKRRKKIRKFEYGQ